MIKLTIMWISTHIRLSLCHIVIDLLSIALLKNKNKQRKECKCEYEI